MKQRLRGLLSLWLAIAMACSLLAVPAAAAPSMGTVLYTGFAPLSFFGSIYSSQYEDVTFQADVPFNTMTNLSGWKAQALKGWKCWGGTWDSGDVKNLAAMDYSGKISEPDASMTQAAYDEIVAGYLVLEPVFKPFLEGHVSVGEFYSDSTGIILEMPLNEQTEIMGVVDEHNTDANSVLTGWKLWHSFSGNTNKLWESETPEGEIEATLANETYNGAIELEPVFGPKYRFIQQPAAENDYTVEVNEPDGVTYAWYPVQVYDVVDDATDPSTQIGVGTGSDYGPSAMGSCLDKTWTAAKDSGSHILMQYLPIQAGDTLTITTDGEMAETMWSAGDEFVPLSPTDTGYTFTADKDMPGFFFGLMSETASFTATITLTRPGETAVTGQTAAAFTGQDDGTYVCKATFPDGVTITSDPVDYTYVPAPAWTGDGTEASPYLIDSYELLAAFAANVSGTGVYDGAANSFEGKYIKLADTFPTGGTATELTAPIGGNFKGHFDGSGKTVVLNISDTSSRSRGLFGDVSAGGVVENVTTAGQITSSGSYLVGGIAGNNRGTVINCMNTAAINILTTGGVLNSGGGGVVGFNTGTVQACVNTGEVTNAMTYADTGTGGVVGVNANGTVQNCYNTGTVTACRNAGGVAGINKSTIANCVSLGATVTLTGNGSTVGRVAGSNASNGTLSGNQARADMEVYKNNTEAVTPDSAADGIHGADVAVNNTVALSTVFTGWDTGVWTIPDGNLNYGCALPTLRGLAQAPAPTLPGEAPAHTVSVSVKERPPYCKNDEVFLMADVRDAESEEPMTTGTVQFYKGGDKLGGVVRYSAGGFGAKRGFALSVICGTSQFFPYLNVGENTVKAVYTPADGGTAVTSAPFTVTVSDKENGNKYISSMTVENLTGDGVNYVAPVQFSVSNNGGEKGIKASDFVITGTKDGNALTEDTDFTVDATDTTASVKVNYPGTYVFTAMLPDSSNYVGMEISDSVVVLAPFTVTYTLEHLTAADQPAKVNYGKPLSATLRAEAGYKLPQTITVSMAGTTLNTGYTYDSAAGTVDIDHVTGDVTITAKGVAKSADATLSALSYKVGNEGETTDVPNFVSGTETYNVELPYDTAATASITLTGTPAAGATVTTNAGVTLSGGSGTATITVTAESGATKTYTVRFTTAADTRSGAKEITAFTIPHQVGRTVIDQGRHTIAVTMPGGTDVTGLTPAVTVSAHAAVNPASGVAQDFTDSVTYTVTAENGTTQDYTATVTRQTHTVTFDPAGGEVDPATAVTGGDGKLADLPTPTRSGSYRFDGWYTAADGGDAVTAAWVFDNDATLYAHWTYTGGSSSTGGSSGGGSHTTTERHPDGSTTTTTKKPDGTVVETTKAPGGTQTVVETKKDGTVTETVRTPDGAETQTVTAPDGAISQTQERPDGVKAETAVTSQGKSTASVTVPEDRVVAVALPAGEGNVAVVVQPDGTRETVRLSVVEDGVAYVVLDASATVEIEQRLGYFDDTPGTAAEEPADFGAARELWQGVADRTFAPDMTMDRAMLAVILHRLAGEPEARAGAGFADVDPQAWYASAADWAAEAGVVTGAGRDAFAPDVGLTREQMAVMLYRYCDYADLLVPPQEAARADLAADLDEAGAGGWAYDAILWAVNAGLLELSGDCDLTAPVTRGEAARILQGFVEYLVKR